MRVGRYSRVTGWFYCNSSGANMFSLTFIKAGKLHKVTSPSFWSLYALRKTTPASRLWDKKGTLVW